MPQSAPSCPPLAPRWSDGTAEIPAGLTWPPVSHRGAGAQTLMGRGPRGSLRLPPSYGIADPLGPFPRPHPGPALAIF